MEMPLTQVGDSCSHISVYTLYSIYILYYLVLILVTFCCRLSAGSGLAGPLVRPDHLRHIRVSQTGTRAYHYSSANRVRSFPSGIRGPSGVQDDQSLYARLAPSAPWGH